MDTAQRQLSDQIDHATQRLLGAAPAGSCGRWALRPLGAAAAGRCARWELRPLGAAYSGRMDTAQRQLSDQIDHATQRLLGTARALSDPDLRAPSLLPGWTRAHVLAHLARGADAMRHLLVGARSGEERPAYASERQRQADIDRDARGTAKDLAADLADSAMAFRTVARGLPDGAWGFRVRILGSAPFPAAELLLRRLTEVELHHGDLGAGFGPADWPAAFADLQLPEPMRSQRLDRLTRADGG